MKLRKLFLLSISALLLSGCGTGSHETSESTSTTADESTAISSDSVEPEKSQVYVLPTTRGEKYLRKSSGVKSLIDVRKDNADNSYHMVIDQSAIDGTNARFHDSGTVAYSSNDIDVLLFGIGTNFNNSVSADTLLYASLTEEEATDLKSNADSSDSQGIVTGVSYDYGTGPLQYNTTSEQLIWLKTTVMEEQNGVYIASPTVDIRYTPVYVQFSDTVAPVMDNIDISLSYSNYLAYTTKGMTANEWVKMHITENMRSSNSELINTDEIPTLKDVVYSNGKLSYDAGDIIQGTYTVEDSSGNVSIAKSFKITIFADYNEKVSLSIPYRELTSRTAEERQTYLKTEFLKEFKKGKSVDKAAEQYRSSIAVSDVTLMDYTDDVDSSMLDIKSNIQNKTETALSASVGKYGTIQFGVKLIDTYPVKSVTLEYSGPALVGKLKTATSVDEFAKMFASYIMTINDDFEDTYTLQLKFANGSTDDDEYYTYSFVISDSSSNSKTIIDMYSLLQYGIYDIVTGLVSTPGSNITYKYTIAGESIAQ